MSIAEPRFEIIVNRWGNVGVYRRYPDGHLRFWTYARSIEAAKEEFKNWPTTTVHVSKLYEPPTI